MINAVMQYGLEPGGEGWKSVLAVRFLHCSVRKRQTLVTEDGTSSIVPINQTDLVRPFSIAYRPIIGTKERVLQIGTLLGFQSSVIIGLTRLWTHLTPQERNDYTHLWRYLGYLIGIKEEYNPLAHGFMASLGSFRDYLELCTYHPFSFVIHHTHTASQSLAPTKPPRNFPILSSVPSPPHQIPQAISNANSLHTH